MYATGALIPQAGDYIPALIDDTRRLSVAERRRLFENEWPPEQQSEPWKTEDEPDGGCAFEAARREQEK